VVFILFTCLIFTIAMPYGASMFFMALLLCSYIALSFISIFYLGVQFELYQIGWMIVIPLVLSSSALLLKKVRELFNFKKVLENQIASYDKMEDATGLTIEKAYYNDLKYAMDRASKGETTLTLEMITICHLDTLKSMNGNRLWDEILYKTLKIIKQHCYSTHLIYILDGSVFSILMENTSVKNQLLINQEITDAFAELIKEYDSIDADVTLDIAALPYTRNIANPLDYRALVKRHLNN
jgi:PleD family two-component response regulator